MATQLVDICSNNATNDLHFILEYSISQNVSQNQSTVTITAYFWYKGGYASVRSANSTIKVDGQTIKTGEYIVYAKNGKTKIGSVTKTVNHNSDGAVANNVSISYYIHAYHWSSDVNTSKSISKSEFGTISQESASTITSISNTTLGNPCTVKWTPATKGLTYKIRFTFGDGTFSNTNDYVTSLIKPNTTSAYTYTVPAIPLELFAPQMTDRKQKTMTAYLYTYQSNGSTMVGQMQSKSFTVTIPENDNTRPTIENLSCSVYNTGSDIPQEWGSIAISGFSKARFTGTPTAKYSASISSISITGDYTSTISGSSLNHISSSTLNWSTVSNSGENNFYVIATDSRGIQSQRYKLTISNVYAYSEPSIISYSVYRDSNTNTTIKCNASWSYTSLNNNNQIKVSIKRGTSQKYPSSGDPNYGTNTSISDTTLESGVPLNTSYSYTISIEDKLGKTKNRTVTVSTAKVLLDFKEGGECLGIGRMVATSDSGLVVALGSKFEEQTQFMRDTYFNTNSTPKIAMGNTWGTNGWFSLRDALKDMYYEPGDNVTLKYDGGGYLTGNRQKIYFQIPLNKNIRLVDQVSVSSLQVSIRALSSSNAYGGYLICNTSENSYGGKIDISSDSSYTIGTELRENGLLIEITASNSLQIQTSNSNNVTAYNNAPVGVSAEIIVAFSKSSS